MVDKIQPYNTDLKKKLISTYKSRGEKRKKKKKSWYQIGITRRTLYHKQKHLFVFVLIICIRKLRLDKHVNLNLIEVELN